MEAGVAAAQSGRKKERPLRVGRPFSEALSATGWPADRRFARQLASIALVPAIMRAIARGGVGSKLRLADRILHSVQKPAVGRPFPNGRVIF